MFIKILLQHCVLAGILLPDLGLVSSVAFSSSLCEAIGPFPSPHACSLLLLAASSRDAASHLLVVAVTPGLSPQLGSAAPKGRRQPVTAFQKPRDVQN